MPTVILSRQRRGSDWRKDSKLLGISGTHAAETDIEATRESIESNGVV